MENIPLINYDEITLIKIDLPDNFQFTKKKERPKIAPFSIAA